MSTIPGEDVCLAASEAGYSRRPLVLIQAAAKRLGGLRQFWARYKMHIIAIAASAGITVAIVAFGDQIAALAELGYVGIFFIGLLGNATVVFPVPSLATVFAGGSVLNPWLVGLVSGLGEPLGELTGYMAGYGGSMVIEDTPFYDRIVGWIQNHGSLTIFILSAIPNPLFDVAGITAGALHFPVRKFLFACWLGKTLKATLVALLGSVTLGWLQTILVELGF